MSQSTNQQPILIQLNSNPENYLCTTGRQQRGKNCDEGGWTFVVSDVCLVHIGSILYCRVQKNSNLSNAQNHYFESYKWLYLSK